MSDNISSINSPLKFFEFFFPKDFDRRYNNFFNSDIYTILLDSDIGSNEYFYNVIELKEDDGYIIVEDMYKENPKQYKELFIDEFQYSLKHELNLSIQYTQEALLKKNSKEAQQTLLHSLLSNMAYIIDNSLPLICNQKYLPLCESILLSYIQQIEVRYSDYISREKSIYLKYLTPKSVNASYSLNMTGAKFKQLDELLKLLKEEGFVEESLSLEFFKKAFDNTPITKPLNIKWIKLDRKQTYLGGITELMQQLKDKKYIGDFDDAQLSKIFVRADGSSIKVYSWKSARNNTKPGKSGKRNNILFEIDYVMKNF